MQRYRFHASKSPFDVTNQSFDRTGSVIHTDMPSWVDFGSTGSRRRQRRQTTVEILPVKKGWLIIWLLAILVGLGVLASRAYYLQLVQGQHFLSVADGNRIRVHDIKASRGIIYDRQLTPLVENIPRLSLAIVPVDIPEERLENLIERVGEFTSLTRQEILEKIEAQPAFSYRPIIIAENIEYEQAVQAELLSNEFPALVVVTESTRNYLHSEEHPSLSHILGYPSRIREEEKKSYLEQGYSLDDFVGRSGLELSYETELKGQNGKEQVEVDATGEPKEIIARREPVEGKNLVLTLDFELQQVAEQALKKQLSLHQKQKGTVVVLDPNSGEVLAMTSLPGYNNNLFAQGISTEDFSRLVNDDNLPLFNRAISGEYPSGSTFKMIVAAAALQEGVITPSTGFSSVGGISVSRWFFPDWKAGGHGWTTLSKALAESVNTFFYIIGGGYDNFTGLGVEKIKTYAERFGLNHQLGIDLPQEADGFLPSIDWKEEVKGESWYIGDTYHLAIGQGDLLVTPLQVGSWTSVFANDGTLYKPYIVREILDSKNNPVEEAAPVVLDKDFIDRQHLDAVNRGLRQAVTSGSAVRLSLLPISAAGKTGTAQWSTTGVPHAWFTSYAPYDNPQLVVTVLVEQGGEGSSVALPVAYDIYQWWAENRYQQ